MDQSYFTWDYLQLITYIVVNINNRESVESSPDNNICECEYLKQISASQSQSDLFIDDTWVNCDLCGSFLGFLPSIGFSSDATWTDLEQMDFRANKLSNEWYYLNCSVEGNRCACLGVLSVPAKFTIIHVNKYATHAPDSNNDVCINITPIMPLCVPTYLPELYKHMRISKYMHTWMICIYMCAYGYISRHRLMYAYIYAYIQICIFPWREHSSFPKCADLKNEFAMPMLSL